MHLNLFIIIKLNFSGHLQVVEEITLRDFNSARNGLQSEGHSQHDSETKMPELQLKLTI